jgi:hypothetical protein
MTTGGKVYAGRLAVEHDPTNDVPAEMSSVVSYYAVPDPSLGESDRIALGDAASGAAHELVAEDCVERTLTSAPRGDDSDKPFTVSGMEESVTPFRVTVPVANHGIRLSRLADMAAGRQSAVVSVDGVVVGSWSSAESNATLRFAELVFDVPASFTAGKRSLAVEIDARGSSNPWTAYGYTVRSHLAA